MGEYLELALAVIEGREDAVSADTAIFQLIKKQCPRLQRKLRGINGCFPRVLESYLRIFKDLARTMTRQRESVTRSPEKTSFLMNEIQCTHLWRVIRVVYNYLSSNQLPLAHCKRQCFINIFRDFLLLVTRANTIVQQFDSQQSWLMAAFLHGNNRLAFKEIILGLQDCVDSFYKRTGHHIPVDDSATIWRQDADMEGDARVDATEMISTVEVLLALPDLGNEERLLAHHIFEREEIISSSDNKGIDVRQFSIPKEWYPTCGEPIGCGASGTVLEVKWLLGTICAKKLFLDVTDDEGSMQKECLKEASILTKLNHPHIVKLLCMSEPPVVSFLMERMPMNLSKFLRNHHKNGIMPAAAIDMMLQIVQGIECIHDQNIAHRDVKSPNILVSPSEHPELQKDGYGVLKLADLGLAKIKAHVLTKPTQEKMGTPFWLAPEAWAADKPIDWKKADAYSFAMVCSEILTGDTPFNCGRPRSELYNRIVNGERPTLPPSCPDALASLMKICWSTNPSERPSFSHIREELTFIKRGMLTGSLEWTTSLQTFHRGI